MKARQHDRLFFASFKRRAELRRAPTGGGEKPALAAPVNPCSGKRQILAGSLHAHHGTEFFHWRHQEFSLLGLDVSGVQQEATLFWTSMMISALQVFRFAQIFLQTGFWRRIVSFSARQRVSFRLRLRF